MSADQPQSHTASLRSIDLLTEQTYRELHQIAARCMRGQRCDHTLQPTALVHEAFLRMANARAGSWAQRTQFLAVAATAMRRILIDSARRRRAAKRDGGVRVTLVDGSAIDEQRPLDVLALDEALARLSCLDERSAHVVELRFFGGLELDEIAEIIGVSVPTAKRDWRFAKAWLNKELRDEDEAAQ